MRDVKVLYQEMYQSISDSMDFQNQDHQTLARCIEYFSTYNGKQNDAEESFPKDIKDKALAAVNKILREPSEFNKNLRSDWLKHLPVFMQPPVVPPFPKMPKLQLRTSNSNSPARAPAPPTPRDVVSPKQSNAALPITPTKSRRGSIPVKKKQGFFSSSPGRDSKTDNGSSHKNDQSKSI